MANNNQSTKQNPLLEIETAEDDFTIEGGKKKLVQAIVLNSGKPAEKELLWKAEFGEINKEGMYTAPATKTELIDYLTVVPAYNKDAKKTITVKVLPLLKKEEYADYISVAEIKPIGKDGVYCINIQAVNQFGFGNKCSLVITDFDQNLPRILPAEDDRPPIEEWSQFQIRVKTSKKGFFSIHLLPFKEKERRLHIRVKGTTIDREVVLSGPKEKMKFDSKAGFWANFNQDF